MPLRACCGMWIARPCQAQKWRGTSFLILCPALLITISSMWYMETLTSIATTARTRSAPDQTTGQYLWPRRSRVRSAKKKKTQETRYYNPWIMNKGWEDQKQVAMITAIQDMIVIFKDSFLVWQCRFRWFTDSILCRSVVYIDGVQIVIWDSTHYANSRVCATLSMSRGSHRIYIIAFEYEQDSTIEVTYSGPDTFDVRTHIGGIPFFPLCNPFNVTSAVNSFTLCTFKSEPTTARMGDCTPTVGIAHPRLTGPCEEALVTTISTWEYYSGGDLTPVLGSANDKWVKL